MRVMRAMHLQRALAGLMQTTHLQHALASGYADNALAVCACMRVAFVVEYTPVECVEVGVQPVAAVADRADIFNLASNKEISGKKLGP